MSSENVISTNSEMEPAKDEIPKITDMVMCGDHPSVPRPDRECREEKEKSQVTYGRLSPTSSRTDKRVTSSEHALRAMEARRQMKSLEVMRAPTIDVTASGNRALVQAALGSFRWPPYLLVVWAGVLLLTHALHGLVALLERALPPVRKFCHYFYAWAEESWKMESDTRKVVPLGLAIITGVLYTIYSILFVMHAAALWSVEPLCEGERTSLDEAQSSSDLGK